MCSDYKKPWKRFRPIKMLGMMILFIGFVLAMGWVVMFLWNMIMPSVFNANQLTYTQAIGLLVLCKILFGGFGGRRDRWQRKKEHWNKRWNSKWKEKWDNMSEEERAKVKERWRR